jgi:MFS family permease
LPKGKQGFSFMNARSPTPSREPTLIASLRALPRPVWILFFGTFLNKFGTFVVPFLTLYLTREGYSLTDAGIAIGAYGVGHLVASLLGGHLADTFGRRKTIALSMFSAAAAMMLLSQARNLPLVIVLAALAGLTCEMYRPAASALLADLTPAGQRVTAFSAYRLAFNAGWAFGPATGGFLAAYGFFWLFAGDALTSVLFGLVALVALPRGVRSQQNGGSWGETLRGLKQDKQFQQALLASFAISLVFFQMATTFGLHVTQLGFSPGVYGTIISLNGALVVCCELPLTTITRRFPARKTIAAGYLLIGIGFALNAFARSVPELVGCMILFTLGEMIAMPITSAYIADLAPPLMRGRYMGMFGLTWAVGLIIAPGMGMKLLSLGPQALWFCCGALGLVAAGIVFRTSPTLPAEKTLKLRGQSAEV